MLCNLKTLLNDKRENKWAVGSFNVYSLETIKGVCEAARKTEKPAIISFGSSYLKNMDLEEIYFLAKKEAEKSSLPMALHLDHCSDFETIKNAVDAGFTSVMYDGSFLPFEENLENTKKVCEMAHEKNVSVEAELGSLALGEFSNETEIDHGESYTNPKDAAEFVKRTGIDALAVSIGTVHGLYKGKPDIRVDILKKIAEEVSIPLVLHGGSGTDEKILKECINNGICKINVNTEISYYTVKNIMNFLEENPNTHLSEVSLLERKFVGDVVVKYINLFANGK